MRNSRGNLSISEICSLIFGPALALIACAAIIWGLFKLFTIIDCNTATRNLKFLERCDNNPDCELTEREKKSVKAFSKMQILRCENYDE